MLRANGWILATAIVWVTVSGCGKKSPSPFQTGFYAPSSGETGIVRLMAITGDEANPKIYSYMAKACGEGDPEVNLSVKDQPLFDSSDGPVSDLHGADQGCEQGMHGGTYYMQHRFRVEFKAQDDRSVNLTMNFTPYPETSPTKTVSASFTGITKEDFQKRLLSDQTLKFAELVQKHPRLPSQGASDTSDLDQSCKDLFARECATLIQAK